MENPFKIQPKSIKNQPKTELGAVFGLKYRLPSILEASGMVFGAVLARLGRQVGAMLAPKRQLKARKNHSKNPSKFRCLLEPDFNEVSQDFSTQNGSKMDPSWNKNSSENR